MKLLMIKRLKGGILYYSLLVIILSSSVAGLILLSSYFENRILMGAMHQEALERDTRSALNLYLVGEDFFRLSDTASTTLYANNSNRVLLSKKRWGLYTIISVSSHWKNKSDFLLGLTGSDIFSAEPVALYMQDDGRVLSLSGNTILKGTCYLPGKTARPSAIEGQQYNYKDLVFGTIKQSAKTLPALDSELLESPLRYLNEGTSDTDSIIRVEALDSQSLGNSFSSRTIIIKTDSIGDLNGYSLKGNVIIWATGKLIIEKTTNLEDVILLAPKILVKSGFTGTFQAFALQSISLEKDCDLKFPSQLCVVQSEAQYDPGDSLIISIESGTKLSGGVIIKSAGLTSFIKIAEETTLYGQVYCPGIVEIHGNIIGSVYCKTFYIKTLRARYYNHLLNARIDFPDLSRHFVGVDLLKTIKEKKLIKWLD